MMIPKGEVSQKDLFDGLMQINRAIDDFRKEVRGMFPQFKKDELDPIKEDLEKVKIEQQAQGKKIDRLWWQFGTVATLAFIIFEILIRKFIDGIFK